MNLDLLGHAVLVETDEGFQSSGARDRVGVLVETDKAAARVTGLACPSKSRFTTGNSSNPSCI